MAFDNSRTPASSKRKERKKDIAALCFFVGECGEGGDHSRCKHTGLVLVFIDPTMEDSYVFRN
ncbi:hypothetical protein Hanom_Chr01g00034031 [Helianthus anomalus]